jgi:hypothetical protein
VTRIGITEALPEKVARGDRGRRGDLPCRAFREARQRLRQLGTRVSRRVARNGMARAAGRDPQIGRVAGNGGAGAT